MASGPVYLPKIFNGKDKLFWTITWNGIRQSKAETTDGELNRTVPTLAMRNGDFSDFTGVIYNPLSGRNVNGVPTRDPVPGNIVPATLQDPAGKSILASFPAANTPSPQPRTPWVQNFVYSYKWPRDYDSIVLKFDHYFSSKNQMFVRINQGEALKSQRFALIFCLKQSPNRSNTCNSRLIWYVFCFRSPFVQYWRTA